MNKNVVKKGIVAVSVVAGLYVLNFSTSASYSNKSTGLVSVMIENSDGEYVKSSSDEFPLGMVLNEELSYCVNGSKLDYDESLGKIKLSGSTSDDCHIYFMEKDMGEFSNLILDNNGGASYIRSKGEPNFASAATEDEGMFMTSDVYGSTYYFRGAVENNWVEFAGFYWRIVRINGDGSVRLIYSGTEAPTEEEKVAKLGKDTGLDIIPFNLLGNSAEYAGYMYELGVQHGLKNDSNIKEYNDEWYYNNLINYDDYIVDNGFCYSREAYSSFSSESKSSGIGVDEQYFQSAILLANNNPSLLCESNYDYYTVEDSDFGNSALLYPIALLTAEEMVLAGGKVNNKNASYYLYSDAYYWFGSPYSISLERASVYLIKGSSSTANYYYVNEYSTYQSRPVISIDGSLSVTGDGSWDSPYKYVEN